MIDLAFNSFLLLFSILLFASMSGLISEKAGIINIAINGLMIFGGFMFRIFGFYFDGQNKQYTIIFAIICAGFAAGFFALIHGFATIKLKADHVVSGTAVNLLSAGIVIFLVNYLGPKISINGGQNHFKSVYENKYLFSDKIQDFNFNFTIIAILIASSLFIFLKYTKFGFRLNSIGENPNAADVAAINVNKYKWAAVFASGIFAGIAGSITVIKIGIFDGNVQGLGFLALAIMILGQWRLPIIVLVTMIFSFTYSVSETYVIKNVPKSVFKLFPFVLSLLSLILLSKFQAVPKAIGKHFNKSQR